MCKGSCPFAFRKWTEGLSTPPPTLWAPPLQGRLWYAANFALLPPCITSVFPPPTVGRGILDAPLTALPIRRNVIRSRNCLLPVCPGGHTLHGPVHFFCPCHRRGDLDPPLACRIRVCRFRRTIHIATELLLFASGISGGSRPAPTVVLQHCAAEWQILYPTLREGHCPSPTMRNENTPHLTVRGVGIKS